MSCSNEPLTGLNLQGFIRVADLQSLTYAAEKAASIAGGETVEQLEVTYLLHVTAEGFKLYRHLYLASHLASLVL